MPKKLSDIEIVNMLNEHKNGAKPVDLIKKYNISRGTFFSLKKKNNNIESVGEYDEITVDQSIKEDESESESEIDSESSNISFDTKLKKFKNVEMNDVVQELDELKYEKPIKFEPNRTEQSFKPKPPEEYKIETEKNNNEKETLDLKRKLIRQIKNYSKEFEPHLKYLIGNTDSQQKKWIDSLALKSNDELIIIRDEISYAISSKNSNNMLKIAYLYGMGFVEKVGTNYLDLRLEGLQQTLAQNRDLDLIMKELSCMYNLNLFNDPRARLIMLTGMTILSIDTKNRIIEETEKYKLNQSQSINQNESQNQSINQNDSNLTNPPNTPIKSNFERVTTPQQMDQIDNLLNKIKI